MRAGIEESPERGEFVTLNSCTLPMSLFFFPQTRWLINAHKTAVYMERDSHYITGFSVVGVDGGRRGTKEHIGCCKGGAQAGHQIGRGKGRWRERERENEFKVTPIVLHTHTYHHQWITLTLT